MALHGDLLEQARHLARKEPRRPKQASLRRSVSAAYYALFHFLVAQASRLVVSGQGPERDLQRRAVSRAFEHKRMKTVSTAFGGAQTDPWKSLHPGAVPPELRVIASTFVDLQQARHEADYDLTRDFSRTEVLGLIAQVERATSLWPSVASSPHARAYLLGLALKTR